MRRYFVLKPFTNSPVEVANRDEWRLARRTSGPTIVLRTDLARLGVVVETTFVGSWEDRMRYGTMFEHRVVGLDARWRYYESKTYAEAIDKQQRIVGKALRLHQARFGIGDELPPPYRPEPEGKPQ
jgi:hypothetical protein